MQQTKLEMQKIKVELAAMKPTKVTQPRPKRTTEEQEFERSKRNRTEGRDWNLNFDDWNRLTLLPCHYCGGSPKARRGLDRVDNNVNYVLENVVPCCWDCNKGKSDKTDAEYITHCMNFAAHSGRLETE